ncbi:hypothetical protein COCNU_08G008750 [Cocos nucifera]|uniref:DUF630 domain-containing protein n=1 Tax=Cocos nucifera TaxID=13894 RepID=A0A8K0N6M1_COCNU|nr:hypothetical protein COCNU_08G008750 [Cocos nucifera]
MGCCESRLEREEIVARCKARRRYMKHLVAERQAFAAFHSLYLRSLRSTGAALLQFANAVPIPVHSTTAAAAASSSATTTTTAAAAPSASTSPSFNEPIL